MRRELLAGCGSRRDKILNLPEFPEWNNLVTLDINSDHNPDVIHDLENLPLPFEDNSFDEIHVYECLEHLGSQGDYKFFFAQFEDFWRILKPEGILFATVPMWNSVWAWGDPSHKRVINEGTLVFLSQAEYKAQIGVTPMSDFRFCYKADFKVYFQTESNGTFAFALQAIKSSE